MAFAFKILLYTIERNFSDFRFGSCLVLDNIPGL